MVIDYAAYRKLLRNYRWSIAVGIVGSILSFLLGYAVCYFTDGRLCPKQLQSSIKHELRYGNGSIFYVPDSDIQLTPRADKSAILRIVGAGDNTLQRSQSIH
jgi:hypothetical protein